MNDYQREQAERLHRDLKMNERIDDIRSRRERGEKLSYKAWEILAYASQACHCGGRLSR
jgi:hypothetical protein